MPTTRKKAGAVKAWGWLWNTREVACFIAHSRDSIVYAAASGIFRLWKNGKAGVTVQVSGRPIRVEIRPLRPRKERKRGK